MPSRARHPDVAPPAPRAGDVLGGCRLEREAASGGMGVVWEATQIALDRRVAVKVIAPALAGNPEFRERFVREAQLAASVHHPNIVDVYDAGEQNDVLYIVMRLVNGVDLETALREQAPLQPARAVRICEQVAHALDAAHRAGLIHRDVTPSNILLSGSGGKERAELTDFGLVKNLDTKDHTKAGAWFGTLAYVAPEALRNEPVAEAADTYSLGCVLYRMLTGQVPFARSSDAAVIAAHLSDSPPEASQIASVSPAMDAVIATSLAKDPNARQASAGELARQAREALSSRVAEPVDKIVPVTPLAHEKTRVAPALETKADPPTQPSSAGRRSGGLITLLVACLAALLGAVSVVAIDRVLGGRDSDRRSRGIPTRPAPVDLAGYSTDGYRASVPRGWRLFEDAVPKGTYTDSSWRAPDPSRAFLKIAYRPGTGARPDEIAGNLKNERAGNPTYAEVAWGPISLNGNEATRWVFALDGRLSSFWAQNPCRTAVAVLGSASPAEFVRWAPTFRAVAASVRPACSG